MITGGVVRLMEILGVKEILRVKSTMSEDQEEHLAMIKRAFLQDVDVKYRRGAAEHGDDILTAGRPALMSDILGEVLDLVVYVYALNYRLGMDAVLSDGLPAPLVAAVMREIARSRTLYGPLTNDHFRAFTIMTEEVGEVGRALLEARRNEVGGHGSEAKRSKGQAIQELVQVMAMAAEMIRNLDDAGEFR